MARSSLTGVERRPPAPSGHDTASLGPSDTSDSGSDITGIGDLEEGDPNQPVDVTVAADRPHPESSAEAAEAGFDTDAAGTGERRSAGGDVAVGEAPDIAPDRVVGLPELSAEPEDLDVPLPEDELHDVRATDLSAAADEGIDEDEEAEEAEEAEAAPPASERKVPRTAPRTRGPAARKRVSRKAAAPKQR